METKEQLVEAVKKWINLDNELRDLAKLVKKNAKKEESFRGTYGRYER